jgi:DtxR family Mn-dependent transcriptional regulator
MAMSDRIEDYLEEIFSLEVSGEKPTVTALAKILDVSKASVVSALKRLCAEDFLEQEKYCSPVLTDMGRDKPLKIFRRHKHLSFLLREVLNIEPAVSEEIACAMEHALDNESEKRLAAFIDFYSEAKKGKSEWIDRLTEGLGKPQDLVIPMIMQSPGKEGRVVRITAPELLRKRLEDSGFVCGASFVIRSCDMGEDIIEIELEGRDTVISMKEAMSVWVLPEEGN